MRDPLLFRHTPYLSSPPKLLHHHFSRLPSRDYSCTFTKYIVTTVTTITTITTVTTVTTATTCCSTRARRRRRPRWGAAAAWRPRGGGRGHCPPPLRGAAARRRGASRARPAAASRRARATRLSAVTRCECKAMPWEACHARSCEILSRLMCVTLVSRHRARPEGMKEGMVASEWRDHA